MKFLGLVLVIICWIFNEVDGAGSGIAPICQDKTSNCARAASYCNFARFRETLRRNCQMTCGYCKSRTGPTGKKGKRKQACFDKSGSCYNWEKNGFCSSSFYTKRVKKQNCRKTCGYC